MDERTEASLIKIKLVAINMAICVINITLWITIYALLATLTVNKTIGGEGCGTVVFFGAVVTFATLWPLYYLNINILKR